LDTYEKILVAAILIFGIAVGGVLLYSMLRDLQAPVSVKWVYDESGRFSGVVVT
jgi:hypothetical protein